MKTLLQWARMPETQIKESTFDKCYDLMCELVSNEESWQAYANFRKGLGYTHFGKMSGDSKSLVKLYNELKRLKALYFPTRQDLNNFRKFTLD